MISIYYFIKLKIVLIEYSINLNYYFSHLKNKMVI